MSRPDPLALMRRADLRAVDELGTLEGLKLFLGIDPDETKYDALLEAALGMAQARICAMCGFVPVDLAGAQERRVAVRVGQYFVTKLRPVVEGTLVAEVPGQPTTDVPPVSTWGAVSATLLVPFTGKGQWGGSMCWCPPMPSRVPYATWRTGFYTVVRLTYDVQGLATVFPEGLPPGLQWAIYASAGATFIASPGANQLGYAFAAGSGALSSLTVGSITESYATTVMPGTFNPADWFSPTNLGAALAPYMDGRATMAGSVW